MRCHPLTRRPCGAALMAVLWLIAILSLACMATLRVITFDLEIASSKVHGSRARQVAEMGIAIASHNLVKRTDPLLRRMDEATGEGFEVKISSEGARFNINWILLQDGGDKALLRDIFMGWGLELDDAQAVTDALVDWVDVGDDEQLNGAEKKFYEGEGRINQPFNRPFYDISEMSFVRGMDLVEAVRPDWREWFTVWSSGGLDVNEASAELLAAAGEIQVEQAEIVPETVRGADGIMDTTDDARLTSLEEAFSMMGVDSSRTDITKRFSVTDNTIRIESIGTAEGAKRKITVILASKSGRPALLERTEEIIP